MCLLQQWFNYSFCNRGHGCRKVLFASSIHRKEVWVLQFIIFILPGIFIPFFCLFPSCMSSIWCLSYFVWVWIVLGHSFGLTSADAETKCWCSNGKTAPASPACEEWEDWICFYSFSVDFDLDKEKFLVWTSHVFSIGVAWSQAVGVFSAVKEFKRRTMIFLWVLVCSHKQPCRTLGLLWVMVFRAYCSLSQLKHFLMYGIITN